MGKFTWLAVDPLGNSQVAEGGSGYTSTGHVWVVATLDFSKPVASYVKTKGHLVGNNQVFFNRRKGPYYLLDLARHSSRFSYTLYYIPVDGEPSVVVDGNTDFDTDELTVRAIVEHIAGSVTVTNVDNLRDFVAATVRKSRMYHACGGVWYIRKEKPRYRVGGRYVHTIETAWEIYKELISKGKNPIIEDNKKNTKAWIDVRNRDVAMRLIEKGIIGITNFTNVRISIATAETLSTIMLGKGLSAEVNGETRYYSNQTHVGYVMTFASGTRMYFIDTDLNVTDITDIKPEVGFDSATNTFIFRFGKYNFDWKLE